MACTPVDVPPRARVDATSSTRTTRPRMVSLRVGSDPRSPASEGGGSLCVADGGLLRDSLHADDPYDASRSESAMSARRPSIANISDATARDMPDECCTDVRVPAHPACSNVEVAVAARFEEQGLRVQWHRSMPCKHGRIPRCAWLASGRRAGAHTMDCGAVRTAPLLVSDQRAGMAIVSGSRAAGNPPGRARARRPARERGNESLHARLRCDDRTRSGSRNRRV